MFFIYENFELQGVLNSFLNVSWQRSYNSIGAFQMELSFDKELFYLLGIGRYIYKKNTDEAYIILERYVQTNSYGEMILVIKGKSISYFLEYRIFSYNGSISLYNFVSNLINDNFINPINENRKLDNLILKELPKELNNISINVDYDEVDVLTAFEEHLSNYGYGFRINFLINEKKFEFEVYQGIQTNTIFSQTFNNISEQEYFESYANEKNVLIYNGTISNNNLKGWERKETSIQIEKPIIDIDFIILENSLQYKYLVDWNLGDVVIAKDSILGISINKNITEIEEFIEPTGTYITVTFT